MNENWNVEIHKRRFFALSALIFTLVGVGHLLRILYSWPLEISGWPVPMYFSWLAFFITALMAFMGWYYMKK